jgi:tetratricopeptide (TPR) repeat protein
MLQPNKLQATASICAPPGNDARSSKIHLDEAIADYDKAIAIDPNFAEAYGNRALCLLELRRDTEAEQDLKKCFALDESLRPVFDPLVKMIKKTRNTKRHN